MPENETEAVFVYFHGGISLCRDGFHLSLDYGRFAAAAVRYKVLTARMANAEKFTEYNNDFDIDLINIILNYV